MFHSIYLNLVNASCQQICASLEVICGSHRRKMSNVDSEILFYLWLIPIGY